MGQPITWGQFVGTLAALAIAIGGFMVQTRTMTVENTKAIETERVINLRQDKEIEKTSDQFTEIRKYLLEIKVELQNKQNRKD